MKKIARIILVVLGIIVIYFSIISNSHLSKNTFNLEEELIENNARVGLIKNLIDFEYDFIHIFSPNQSKDSMERQIGFKHFNLKESTDLNKANILFVKDKKAVAYIYGRTIEKGYYLEMDYEVIPLVIKREDVEKLQFVMKDMKEENPPYKKYNLQKYK